ncbi:MAG: PDZ domain-containing protein, partial [Candidatus Cloacimonetes bacterium]|nr:PDZ domain-containing protein [Candidatus Cloacimonadota bacterium]
MKKLFMLTLLVLLTALPLLAQEAEETTKDTEEKEDQLIIMKLNDLKDVENTDSIFQFRMNVDREAKDAAYFGLYLEDLTFPKAQELHYNGTIGVLITGVVEDSPAWHFRLREDDVITHINGKEVTNYATFEKIRNSLRAGDQISLRLFRDGKTESMDMTVGSRNKDLVDVTDPKVPGKKKLSAG